MNNTNGLISATTREKSITLMVSPLSEELSIAEKIGFSKVVLLNAISNYLDGALAGLNKMASLTAFPAVRLKALQKNLVNKFKDYEKELEFFSIKSVYCVVYDGNEYLRPEPVRRLTQIHLAVLQELRANGVYVGEPQDEYEALIRSFIEMVK